MAFINCKECGLQMSEKAQECPKCGDPNMRVRCKNCLEPIYTLDYSCPKCGQEEPLGEGLEYDKSKDTLDVILKLFIIALAYFVGYLVYTR